MAQALEKVISYLAHISDDVHGKWRSLELFAKGGDDNSARRYGQYKRNDFMADVRSAVREGIAFLAVTADREALPDAANAVCDRTQELPPLNREMVIEILRATHTKTGQLSDDAIFYRLPPDLELAALPLDVIESAFQETSTMKVAEALSKAVARLRKPTGTTLEDIVLTDAVASPITQIVEDVLAWRSEQLPWNEVSSSVLLHGPPGNGKTLLASALAGSIGTPLVATSYSDCQRHGHQGDMLKALNNRVQEAIRSAPCVFFLDELDSFSQRDSPGRRSDYVLGVVNGLLEHLSRLNETPGVVVLAATNHRHLVDPAVIRPGRFDLHLEISNPDRAGIMKILNHSLEGTKTNPDLAPIADQLLGSSAAQVTALVREAKGLARREAKPLSQAHLRKAADRAAPALDYDILWRMAVHEAGHLVVAHAFGLPRPDRATLTMAGGYVEVPQLPLESRESVDNRITAVLAGRGAEQVVFGEALNGAGLGRNSDLALATHLYFASRNEWGLADSLVYAPVALEDLHRMPPNLTVSANRQLKEMANKAVEVLLNNRITLEQLATKLFQQRELSGAELQEFFTNSPIKVVSCGKPAQCV